MIRAEIIANKSIESEMITALEGRIPDFCYSLIPLAHGRGRSGSKSGSAVWPEENFILIAYVDDHQEDLVRSLVETLKQRFRREGIKLFILHD